MAIKVICNRCGKEIDANTYSFLITNSWDMAVCMMAMN